jgi:hypothetical protein
MPFDSFVFVHARSVADPGYTDMNAPLQFEALVSLEAGGGDGAVNLGYDPGGEEQWLTTVCEPGGGGNSRGVPHG